MLTPNLICSIVFVCLALVFVIVELCTINLVSVWFAIGSLAAFVFARIPPVPYYISIIVFFLVSILRLFILRPLAKKVSLGKMKFNSEGYIGKEHFLIKEIKSDEPGEIRIGDIIYNARSKDGSSLAKGTPVIVESIEGNTLIVEKKKEG